MRPKVGQQWRHDPLICSPITSSSSCCDYWDNQSINQSMHLDRPLEWGSEAKTSEHLTLHVAGTLVSALDAIYMDRLTWCRQALTVTDHVERRLQKFRVSPTSMKIMAMPSFPTTTSSGSCHRGLGRLCTCACYTAHQSAPGALASGIQSAGKREVITHILFSFLQHFGQHSVLNCRFTFSSQYDCIFLACSITALKLSLLKLSAFLSMHTMRLKSFFWYSTMQCAGRSSLPALPDSW